MNTAAKKHSSPPTIELKDLGFAFGEQTVLSGVSFGMRGGITLLMGPSGAGKSSLMRTLAGLNEAQPSFRQWGSFEVFGEAPSEDRRPRLVRQHHHLTYGTVAESLFAALPNRSALTSREQRDHVEDTLRACGLHRLLAQLDENATLVPRGDQRCLAIVCGALAKAPALLLDEPMVGLEEDTALEVIALIQHVAASTPVLVVTHHQQHARRLGGEVVLLVGGRVREVSPAQTFFAKPATDWGARFKETRGPHLAPSVPPPPAAPIPSHFCWLLKEKLGGLPRPGVVSELDRDLDGLAGLGVDILVNLEEHISVPLDALRARGIEPVHFPIVDMDAPSPEALLELMQRIDGWIEAGRVVAVHCLAGLGRTGTVLAAYRIWQGESVVDAVEGVRDLRRQMVQSERQERFLRDLAEIVAKRN